MPAFSAQLSKAHVMKCFLQSLLFDQPGQLCVQFQSDPLGGASCYDTVTGWDDDWRVSTVLNVEHTFRGTAAQTQAH